MTTDRPDRRTAAWQETRGWSAEEEATWVGGAGIGAASGAILGLSTAFLTLTGVLPALAPPSYGPFQMVTTMLIEAVAGTVVGGVAGALMVLLVAPGFGGRRLAADVPGAPLAVEREPGAWPARRGTNQRAGRFAGEPETEFPDQSPYRGHFARTYASTGTRYEEVAAAYEYGAQAADQFGGRGWDEAVPELRALWERENPASWDRYREAVRHGWESRGAS